jgi:hypothetical protein
MEVEVERLSDVLTESLFELESEFDVDTESDVE